MSSLSKKSKATASQTSTSRVDRAPASSQELELTNIANEQYQDYMARFAPLNDVLLAKYRTNYERDVAPAIARAEADTRIAASGRAMKATQGAMGGTGRSGTGRGIMAEMDEASILGKALGEAQGGARRNAMDQEFVGLKKLAAQGRDIQDASVTSMAAAGDRASREAIARASRSSQGTSSGNKSYPGDNGWVSDLAGVAGIATSGLMDYMFGAPKPSWESGVVAGNSNSYLGGLVTTPYYDPANDFNAPVSGSSGGGFWDSASNAASGSFSGGSSGSSGFGGAFDVY